MSRKEINDDEWLVPRDALNANDFKKQLRQEIADECQKVIYEEIERLTSYQLPFFNDPKHPDYRKSNSLERILEAIRGDSGEKSNDL